MKSETQGKLMVAMLVSILAFGFGTGTVLVTGLYQTSNPTTTLNTTKQSDLPAIPNTNQNEITTGNTPSTSSPNTPSTPSTPDSGQTDGQDNQNDNPTSSNNTIQD